MIINISNRTHFLALACLFSLGCGSSAIDAEQAKVQALTFVPGEALTVAAGFDAGIVLWDARVRHANQAVLTVSFMQGDGELYGIDDPRGPFDYVLPRPRPDFLTYTEAVAKAMTSKTGEIVDWNLRYKPEGYRYEVYVRDAAMQLWEIKLSAITGEISASVPVAAVD